uniref:Peritrophin-30 n=1 Tax=Lucilia cuprina TaxID=7375 RepID=O97380_LUCCU|nr:peritrophin-30 precursor [Lucilia cuprina]AAD31510.1 peritrophin-30 [Lucilia cuprina]
MKIVTVIASLLVVAHHALALVCPTTPKYNQKINNLCVAEKDLKVVWPDYTNVSNYYICQGLGNPVLQNCFPNTIFSFYQQKCTKCDKYVPAPHCKDLKNAKCEDFAPSVPEVTTTISPCMLPVYTHTFVPTCEGNDIYRLWPNYKNVEKYYWCQAPYMPVIKDCPKGTYFNYYAQSCTDCLAFVEAPDCNKLMKQEGKPNKCVKI